MSSDEVNSIADTTESLQVANIIQNKYYDIVARGDLTIDDVLFQLVPPDSLKIPVTMQLPEGVTRISWMQYFDTNPQDNQQIDQFGAFSHDLNTDLVSSIKWTTTSTTSNTIGLGNKSFTVGSSGLPISPGQIAQANSGTNALIGTVAQYTGTTLVLNVTSTVGSGTFASWIITSVNVPNVPPGYKYVSIVPTDYFLDSVNRNDLSQPFVQSYTFSEGGNKFTFRYRTDHQPQMCTVVSNNQVIFDSFDSTQDGTLQASKTLCYGQIVPPFQLVDNFIPALNDHQFPLLLNESTSLAFYELKQQTHQKADEEIRRQWAVTQKTKSIANKPGYFDQFSTFGRVPRTGGYGTYPQWPWMRGGVSLMTYTG